MKKKVSVCLVGIGGYGKGYLSQLLENPHQKDYTLAGVVDIKPEESVLYSAIVEKQIPVFNTMEEFYAQSTADLTVISTPIQFHCEQACYALEQGSHVLCEKPIAATVQEALKMKAWSEKYNRFVAIGFNWSFDHQLLQLKQSIMEGQYGKPLRFKTLVMWPRSEEYFSRNWAARKKSADGKWILDSVAHNATAHYLHNMFYMLGDQVNQSAKLEHVEGELYRANPIENFDTCALRAYTEDRVEIVYLATHAIADRVGPRFSYEFEKATISYDINEDASQFIVRWQNGETDDYNQAVTDQFQKLWTCIDAVAAQSSSIPCGIEAALSQVICVNGVQESVPEIVSFPESMLEKQGTPPVTVVDGLADVFMACYEKGVLPSDGMADWAKKGKRIDLQDYREFRG